MPEPELVDWDRALARASAVCTSLVRWRFSAHDEAQLQDAVEQALRTSGIAHAREVALDDAGRIDFLTADGVGLELKVKGSATSVLRQLERYAHAPRVSALVLVTTRAQHRAIARAVLRVPVLVHHIGLYA